MISNLFKCYHNIFKVLLYKGSFTPRLIWWYMPNLQFASYFTFSFGSELLTHKTNLTLNVTTNDYKGG